MLMILNAFFQPAFTEMDEKATTDKFTQDTEYEYFIQLAILKEMPWKTLAFMLTDLTTTLDRSKQIIKVLVLELEKLASKFENEHVQKELIETICTNENQVNEQTEAVKTNFGKSKSEHFDYLDSDNESITDDSDNESITYDSEKQSYEATDQLDVSKLKVQTEHSEENNIVFDFPADKFYEFIGNNEKLSPVSSDNEDVELPNEETTSNCESKEKQMDHKKDKPAIDGEKGKKNSCSFCGKCFLNKAWKERHERIHTGEKPFECKFCQKRFIEKGKVKVHERIHTGDKPYQCKTCNASFAQSGILKKHEKCHNGGKPHQCQTCNASFNRLSSLTMHQKIHN